MSSYPFVSMDITRTNCTIRHNNIDPAKQKRVRKNLAIFKVKLRIPGEEKLSLVLNFHKHNHPSYSPTNNHRGSYHQNTSYKSIIQNNGPTNPLIIGMPFRSLTQLWKITMFNRLAYRSSINEQFSIAMLNYLRSVCRLSNKHQNQIIHLQYIHH